MLSFRELLERRWTSIVVGVVGALLVGMSLGFFQLPRQVLNAVCPVARDLLNGRDTALASDNGADDDNIVYLPVVFSDYYGPPPQTLFGVQLYRQIDEATQDLAMMRKGQVFWARWPLGWSGIEPVNTTPDQFRWASADRSILNAYENGQELIVTIVSNPSWAATYSNGPIDRVQLSEFAEFMAAVVERYDGDGYADAPGSPVVNYFEFYNEPDGGVEMNAASGHPYWGPFGDQYAEMLCVVYPAMKAANPSVQIVLGGIAYDNFLDEQGRGAFVQSFLGDVLAAGGKGCFDVMNFHYYPPFEDAWSPYGAGLAGKANYLRQHYDLGGKPMMVTEAGWHSEDYSIYPSSPELQTRYVIELFTQAMSVDLKAVTWWTWLDPGGGYGPNGLLTADLEPKPAFDAFGEAAVRLGQATFEGKVDVGAGIQAYRFRTQDNRLRYVLWSNDASLRRASLPLGYARLVGVYGQDRGEVMDHEDGKIDGRISIWVGLEPVYVEAIQ